tara:strand:- start:204 stop:425 length:222 start_codon:yes stop_codon:yes gene_type:complete
MRAIIFEAAYTPIITLDITVFSRIGTFGRREDLILPHFGALAQPRVSLSLIMTTETLVYSGVKIYSQTLREFK